MIDFTRPEDIDLDASEKALLDTFKRNEGNSLKIQSLKKDPGGNPQSGAEPHDSDRGTQTIDNP